MSQADKAAWSEFDHAEIDSLSGQAKGSGADGDRRRVGVIMYKVCVLAALFAAFPAFAQVAAVPPPAQEGVETVAPPAAAPSANDMRLICRGTGERSVMGLSWGTAFTKHHAVSAVGGSSQLDQFGEQMDIDIDGQDAKVRVPRRFLPPAHGGEGGWFAVKDLVVADDAITGKVMINFAQHPNLRIDRRSGSVALDGKVGSFAGQCEKFDPSKRAF